MTVAEEAAKIVKAIRAMREFSGENIMDCRQALRTANGDPLLALGKMRIRGHLVHVKGDIVAWELRQAESYARNLVMGDDGKIRYIEPRSDFSTPRP